MSTSNDHKRLRFPCECVSGSAGGYSDPWTDVTKHKMLPDGTKEEIVNLVAQEPKTISQLAEALHLSSPSVHTHISDMLKSELIRESEVTAKKHPTERYYEPNFPVFKTEDCAEFKLLCDEIAQKVATVFEEQRAKLEQAFHKTGLKNLGWEFPDVAQCLYANIQRGARTLLEQRGSLVQRRKHANGADWIFWAEEPPPNGDSKLFQKR